MASLPEAGEALSQRDQWHLFLFAGLEVAQRRRIARELVRADDDGCPRVELVGALHPLAEIAAIAELDHVSDAAQLDGQRQRGRRSLGAPTSQERPGGKEGVGTCTFRWSPHKYKNTQTMNTHTP